MRSSKPIIGVVLDYDDDSLKTSMPKYKIRENYFGAISKAGGIPMGLPLFTERVEEYLGNVDGVLVTGGCFESPDYWYINSNIKQKNDGEKKVRSKRIEFDELLIKGALDRDIPVLGICAGMQTLAVIGGYKLLKSIKQEISEEAYKEHKKVDYDYSHDVEIVKNTKLHRILQSDNITVNSLHSEAVFQEPLNKSFLVTSVKTNEGIIEAVESINHKFVLGVQWHPETHINTDKNSQKIFSSFIENCR